MCMTALHDWAIEWLDALERPTEATRQVYERSVRQFLDWLGETHPTVRSEADLTRSHVVAWLRHLAEQGRSEATRRVRAIAVRKWLQYVADEEDSELDDNPAAEINLPVPQAPPIAVLSDEELTKLLRVMSGSDFLDRRDTAIVRLLLDAGIRREELVKINVEDLNLEYREVLVHGKGGKDRVVPFGSRTAVTLRRYLRARAKRPAAESPALFLSTRPRAGGGWRMTGGGVADMLKRRSEAAGLPPIHPHQFRHTWASDMKRHGLGDDQLERLAGWSTPIMSRRYGNSVADQHAREVARKLARGDRV